METQKTGLMTSEMRTFRSDLIEVFKIMEGLEGLRREEFFIIYHSECTEATHIRFLCKHHD